MRRTWTRVDPNRLPGPILRPPEEHNDRSSCACIACERERAGTLEPWRTDEDREREQANRIAFCSREFRRLVR